MTTTVALILLCAALALIFVPRLRPTRREVGPQTPFGSGQVESELLRRPLRSHRG